MASDAKLKPYCPSRNYNSRISDKTMNLSFLNSSTHQQEKNHIWPFIKFNSFKLNHMNLFLGDHLHVLVNSRLLLLACRREWVDFHQEKKREVWIWKYKKVNTFSLVLQHLEQFLDALVSRSQRLFLRVDPHLQLLRGFTECVTTTIKNIFGSVFFCSSICSILIFSIAGKQRKASGVYSRLSRYLIEAFSHL